MNQTTLLLATVSYRTLLSIQGSASLGEKADKRLYFTASSLGNFSLPLPG
jgi:hypothetical protein